MRRFIERNDLNRDGQLDFIEFVGVLLLLDDKSWDSELQSRFVALDVDRDGRISHEELLRSLTPQIGREAALAYLKEFDKDDDGQISYKEFILRVLEVGLAMPGPAEEGDLLAKVRGEVGRPSEKGARACVGRHRALCA